jgi:hypothetical protein
MSVASTQIYCGEPLVIQRSSALTKKHLMVFRRDRREVVFLLMLSRCNKVRTSTLFFLVL